MHQRFAAAHRENAPFIDETSNLLIQRLESEKKAQLLEAFNRHFIMSEDELRTLTSGADSVDDAFFQVLTRVKRIHNDCQVLLGTENQRLGLELMEQSSRNLNSAYQKLYRWVQREFKTLNFENPQLSFMIRRSLKELAERPTLFQSCLEFFAEAREHVLLDSFYSALSGSNDLRDHEYATKPIEYHSHDPLRYIGDMLAWTHSTSVSEREALENLADADGDEILRGIKMGTEKDPWSSIDGDVLDGRKALTDLASRNLAGVIQILRQRVEQVIHNQENPVIVYRIVNLLCFYRVTFTKLLGTESDIAKVHIALEDFAFRQFQTILMENVRSLETEDGQLPSDLHLPEFLSEALDHFRTLIKIFDSSLTPLSSREKDFETVANVALDPFLGICRDMASGTEEPSHSVFLINCFQAAKVSLSNYEFIQNKISELEDDITPCMAQLIEYQHSFFLHNSGLHPLVAALAPLSELPASEVPPIRTLTTFSTTALKNASQMLDDFLPSALMDAKDNMRFLNDKQLATDLTAEAAERFCEDFKYVESTLATSDDAEGVGEMTSDQASFDQQTLQLRQLFPRTVGEVRVLLS